MILSTISTTFTSILMNSLRFYHVHISQYTKSYESIRYVMFFLEPLELLLGPSGFFWVLLGESTHNLFLVRGRRLGK